MRLPRGAGWPTAAGLAAGYLADRVAGDPRRWHPVAGFGRLAAGLERHTYRDTRGAGVWHEALLVGGCLLAGVLAERAVAPRSSGRRGGLWGLALTAAATWAVLGGRSLGREAELIASRLAADDLAGARRRIRNLVGRDPDTLDADGIARAVVESVAENTSDAVVAPLCWGAVAGVPGLLGYRAINTLDAMVGHRSPRYLRFGWAAARLDDAANWLPARLTGILTAGLAPLVGGSASAARQTVRRDAAQHPSPNAGVAEAAFAGALGVRLGGVNTYAGHSEDRGVLGHGRPVEVGDLDRATRLADAVGWLSLGLAVGARLGLPAVVRLPARSWSRASTRSQAQRPRSCRRQPRTGTALVSRDDLGGAESDADQRARRPRRQRVVPAGAGRSQRARR